MISSITRLKVAAPLAILAGLAAPAAAQIQSDAIGQIDATVDGTAYRGETLEVPSEGTATANFSPVGPMTTISIQAHDPEAESIMRNVLSLELMMQGTELVGSMIPPTVSYWPGGMNAPFYISDESGTEPRVTIDAVSLTEGDAYIRGSFSAKPCKQESFFAEMDLDDCITVEGTFDTVLKKLAL